MTPKEKRYIKKRDKIKRLVEGIELKYETDECYHTLSPWGYDAQLIAEKILKKFGINKPPTLKHN